MPTYAPSPRRAARNLKLSAAGASALLAAVAGTSMVHAAEHTLMPSPKTVHIGYF
jgi:hypothetical protein